MTWFSCYIASRLFAAQMITLGNGAGLLLLPFGNWIVDKVGEITFIFITVIVEAGRLFLYTIIE